MYLIFDIFDNYFEIVQFTHSNNISTTGNDVMSASTKNVLISFWIMLICGCVTLTCTCMLRKKHLKKQSESCWNQSLGFSCLVSSKFIVSEIRIAQRPRTKKKLKWNLCTGLYML